MSRQEAGELQKQKEALDTAEKARKKTVRDRIKKEVGAEAQLASSSVVAAEVREAAASVKVLKKKGKEIIDKEREELRQTKQAERARLGDSAARAKSARSHLSSMRQTDAENLRRSKQAAKATRQSRLESELIAKAQSREAILKARGSPNGSPSAASRSASPPTRTAKTV